ncbi:MAG: hypothetical protein ABIQ18_39305 [Umezawaea sp.]
MKNSWMRRAGIAFTAAAVGVVVSAGGASAANGRVSTSYNSGTAAWVESSDTLTVCDNIADGWGVRGYIYRPYIGDPGNGRVLFKLNDPSSNGACVSASNNIDESISISIKVCNYQGSDVLFCEYTNLR